MVDKRLVDKEHQQTGATGLFICVAEALGYRHTMMVMQGEQEVHVNMCWFRPALYTLIRHRLSVLTGGITYCTMHLQYSEHMRYAVTTEKLGLWRAESVRHLSLQLVRAPSHSPLL
jgi:hypothetical protein